MKKEVDRSYDLETEAQKSVDQGLTISYFVNTLGAIKSLGITSVRDVPHDKSDMPSYHLVNTLIETKTWLNKMAEAYAQENNQFNGLESLLQGDPLTKAAIDYKWNGLFQPEDKESQEHYQYVAFSVVWKTEKRTKFKELVQAYWEKQKPEPATPSFIKRATHYLGKRMVDLALIGLALGFAGFIVYQNYLKPDIKQEVKSSIPYIPTPDDLVDTLSKKVYPDIEEIIRKNNNISNENIDRIINENVDKAIKQLKESMPWAIGSEEKLRSKVKERIEEKYKKQEEKQSEQKQEPQEHPQDKEEEF